LVPNPARAEDEEEGRDEFTLATGWSAFFVYGVVCWDWIRLANRPEASSSLTHRTGELNRVSTLRPQRAADREQRIPVRR
jgi:hypothetical protein